jgi:hypothetical protein
MATKYPRSNLIGDEGVDFVALVCSRAGALFLSRPRQDVGIDGHIEFLNASREPTGQLVFVQCKAGLSYISPTGAYLLRADQAHFETWSRYSVPVIGIIYNPKARDARWVDLTAHLREHPSCVSSGPFSVEARSDHVFSEDLFGRLSDHLERYSNGTPARDLVDRYLLGSDDATREEALTRLFAQERWTPNCCFVVHAALMTETSVPIIRLLVYMQSFYGSHPDRFYTVNNTMPSSVREHLESIRRIWTSSLEEQQIVRILAGIEPDGSLERGSFGQTVMLLLSEARNVGRKLERIVSKRMLPSDTRCYGLGVLVELGLARRGLLERWYRQETDPQFLEVLRWGLDVLQRV